MRSVFRADAWAELNKELSQMAGEPCSTSMPPGAQGSQEDGACCAAQIYFLVFACGTHLNLWLKQSACPGLSCDHLPPQTAPVHQRNGWHESIACGPKILQSWLLLSSCLSLTWRRQKLRHEPSCGKWGGEVWCYCLVREQPSPTGDSPAWALHPLSQKMHREALCHPSPEGQERHRPISPRGGLAPSRAFGSLTAEMPVPHDVFHHPYSLWSAQAWASSHTSAPLLTSIKSARAPALHLCFFMLAFSICMSVDNARSGARPTDKKSSCENMWPQLDWSPQAVFAAQLNCSLSLTLSAQTASMFSRETHAFLESWFHPEGYLRRVSQTWKCCYWWKSLRWLAQPETTILKTDEANWSRVPWNAKQMCHTAGVLYTWLDEFILPCYRILGQALKTISKPSISVCTANLWYGKWGFFGHFK